MVQFSVDLAKKEEHVYCAEVLQSRLELALCISVHTQPFGGEGGRGKERGGSECAMEREERWRGEEMERGGPEVTLAELDLPPPVLKLAGLSRQSSKIQGLTQEMNN